jgi:hypothetical protein
MKGICKASSAKELAIIMTDKSRHTLIVCVLLAIVVFHMAVAWQDFSTLARNGFLYDDSFYAFQIARNIADGEGMTFDGIHPTTGFQPLYVFLLVPVFMLSGSDPAFPIHIALSMLAIFSGLTAYMLYRITIRYVGFSAAITATLIWGFSPIVIRQTANGLETAIAAFMIAASVLYYLARVRDKADTPLSRFFVLGLLLGLSIVSRIDGTFLALIIVLDYLFVMKRRGGSFRDLARLMLVPAGVLVLYGPWVLFNIAESGSIIQDSGRATRFLSLAYTSYFGYGPESLAFKGPDISFIWRHLEHAISSLKVIPPVQVFFRATEKLDIMFGTGAAFRITGNIAGFILLIGAGITILGWRRDGRRSKRGEVDFLLLYSGVLILSYSLYIFGAFFFMRYFYPIYLVACVYLAFFLQDGFDWLRARSVTFKRATVAAAAVYLFFFSIFSYSQAFRTHPVYPYYDIAQWIDTNTGDEDTLGVFQCGTIGYLCDRKVINLDGKVNREAFFALEAGNLAEYLKDEGIDVVIDHFKIMELFLGITPGTMEASCTRVVLGSMYPSCGWYAFRRALLAPEGVAGEISDPDSSRSTRTLLENK